MMYLMLPGVGSIPSAALSSSESGPGFTGSPFRNLGKGRQECCVPIDRSMQTKDRKGVTDDGYRVLLG